ncbi:MAG: hypothetical protein AB1760_00245 [Pseudomonadota bacterium]
MTVLLSAFLVLVSAFLGYRIGRQSVTLTCDRCTYAYDDHDSPPSRPFVPTPFDAPVRPGDIIRDKPPAPLEDEPRNINGARPGPRDTVIPPKGAPLRPVNVNGARPKFRAGKLGRV